MRPADERSLVEDRLQALFADKPPATTPEEVFWGAQFDIGLAWVEHPEGAGGLGLSPHWQAVVDQRIAAAGGSTRNRDLNVLGIGMGAATLVAHGTEQQKRRWLRPMFTAEEIWCQLFSEPGAGSDLAGLATSAVHDDGSWIVNGQKVWTTLAHRASWGLLLARTDPDVPKHAGLTYFVLDMTGEGIEVRPLYQITGAADFNEVFFRDVVVPDDLRVGEVGQGWKVAMTTLMHERVTIGGGIEPRGAGAIGRAVDVWQEHGHDDDARRDELLRLWIEAEALRLTTIRSAEARRLGTPGPDGSVAKLHRAELHQAITAFTVDLLGAAGMRYPGGYQLNRSSETSRTTTDLHRAFLRARANSIEGGTSEVMKNILGERVLGLPREPRVDRDVPWRELPR